MSVREPELAPALAAFVALYRTHYHLPDAGPLLAVLGAVAANRWPQGAPVWLVLVGAPSDGKTSLLEPLFQLPDVHPVSTLTEAALLSGTPRQERSADATGGLLRKLGTRGTLVLKDFGSVLSKRHETRAELLAALREIYDGRWDRYLGTDGGLHLQWQGKAGLLAAATDAIEAYSAVLSELGHRWLFCRLGGNDERRRLQAEMVQSRELPSGEAKRELQRACDSLLGNVRTAPPEPALDWLLEPALLLTAARSMVVRDSSHEIVVVPTSPEGPGRFLEKLGQLYRGVLAIGACEGTARELALQIALDSIPRPRARALCALAAAEAADEYPSIRTLAPLMGLAPSAAQRHLFDMAVFGVLEAPGDVHSNYRLSIEIREQLVTNPQLSRMLSKSE